MATYRKRPASDFMNHHPAGNNASRSDPESFDDFRASLLPERSCALTRLPVRFGAGNGVLGPASWQVAPLNRSSACGTSCSGDRARIAPGTHSLNTPEDIIEQPRAMED